MSNSLYIAASSINNLMWAQAQTAHNSANVLTPGFKATKPAQMQLPVYGEGLPSTVYSATYNAGFQLDNGSIQFTDDNKHAYINGEGLFTVLGANGVEGYTRRGDMTVDAAGNLLNGDGLAMLSDGGAPIVLPPFKDLNIATNGEIWITPMAGGAAANVAALKLVKPDLTLLEKSFDGLFRMPDLVPLPMDATVMVHSGGYETSNVNYMQCLLDMMNYSRSIDVNSQIIKDADQGEKAANKLLSL